jgi:hypothetical protein
MAIVSDFVVIRKNIFLPIGPTEGNAEVPVGEPNSNNIIDGIFNTGGRQGGTGQQSTAFLTFTVLNLAGSAQVLINNKFVGFITGGGTGSNTQLLTLEGNVLNNGDNRIVLKSVADQFFIKGVVLFFHQES